MENEVTNLISEAQKGNQSAFTELYERSKKDVWFTCISLLKNEANAKDIMQETYITAFSKLDTLKDPTKFLPWIKRIAVNKCKDFLKGRTETWFDDTELEDVTNTEELVVPEEYIINAEKRQCIMQLLEESLSSVQYQTVILYYFDELSVPEISAVMECPEGTVMSRLNLARLKMKKAITAYEEKNNDKLHTFVPIVLFAGLFSAQARDLSIPQIALNISQNTTAAVGYVAKTGGKIMMSMKTKVIIGACAAAVVVGGATATLVVMSNNNKRPVTETSTSEVSSKGENSNSSDEGSTEGLTFWYNTISGSETKDGFKTTLFGIDPSYYPIDIMKLDETFKMGYGVSYKGADRSTTVYNCDTIQELFDIDDDINYRQKIKVTMNGDKCETELTFYLTQAEKEYSIGEYFTAQELYETDHWYFWASQFMGLKGSDMFANGRIDDKKAMEKILEENGLPTLYIFDVDPNAIDNLLLDNDGKLHYSMFWEYPEYTIEISILEYINQETQIDSFSIGNIYYYPNAMWEVSKADGLADDWQTLIYS